MSFSVSTVGQSTKFPLLPEGDYKLQITESNYVQKMFGKDMSGWEPKLVTTEPAVSVDGAPIPPNTRVFLGSAFALEDGPDNKFPGGWIKSLLLAIDAIFGTNDDTRNAAFPNIDKTVLDSSLGRTVLGHVVIDEDKEGVKRNKIKRLKHLAA